jgi:uncharacterized membrane protein
MDIAYIISLVQEITYLLIIFGGFLFYSIFKGRQAVINIVTGLYVALLFSFIFPYYHLFVSDSSSAHSHAIGNILLFLIFTLLGTVLMTRLMPDEFREKRFESLGKKILVSMAGTILVMAFSFQVLPVTEILITDSPLQFLFGNKDYFFWWLFLPMIMLYIN